MTLANSYNKKFLPLYIFIALYMALSLFLPADSVMLAKYGLSDNEAKLLGLTIVIPMVLIWWALFIGHLNLKEYARSIKSGLDSKAIDRLALGAKIYAYGIPLSFTSSILFSFLARNDIAFFNKYAVVVNNYFSLILVLVTFYYFQKGSFYFLKLTKKVHSLPEYLLIIFIILSTVYSFITFRNIDAVIGSGTMRTAYSLSPLVVLATIVIPYIYVWYKGFSAIYNINFYRKHVKGSVYKEALGNLANGISLLLVSSVFAQFISALANRLIDLRLGILLPLVYLFIALIGFSYVLIARGSQKLRRIEEVV